MLGVCQIHFYDGHSFFLAGFASQMPISPTFYEQLLRQNPFAKKLQTQIVST
jgi:hypothetical protein